MKQRTLPGVVEGNEAQQKNNLEHEVESRYIEQHPMQIGQVEIQKQPIVMTIPQRSGPLQQNTYIISQPPVQPQGFNSIGLLNGANIVWQAMPTRNPPQNPEK